MKLWGGRFTKEEDALVHQFNASISFDQRLWNEDILGSLAHAEMLKKQGILTEEEAAQIIDGLVAIHADIADGTLAIDPTAEDIHSFIEAELTSRIGEAGKKLHTGRSRNDQVALDMKLYVRARIDDIDEELTKLLTVINDLMKEHLDTWMPGFTHLQKAQPVTFAHHLGAYFEMFRRDADRLADTRERMNYCPLGAGALAGTTYPLDRAYVARSLAFRAPARNSMDAVSDRDYLIEFLSDLSMIMMHLSRFCEEIIVWNTNEYRFVEMDDAYSTGSSIMPQKKNPDIAELIRGKTGRVYCALISLLTTMKGLPLAYNKDMQEDKEMAFDAIDTVSSCIPLFTEMLRTMKVNREVMAKSAKQGFTNATDAADYLVKKGIPFRDAHGYIGELVLRCLEKNCALDDLPVADYQDICPAFDEDIYEAISLKTCVEKRNTKGAPGMAAMQEEISENDNWLAQR
ncbi:MAG: argininosuccinate lyase [Lachnospiraceae bacterium]|nr:argininosuccinate lyase [Lachnospiraceae bacterium]